jgi:hypothetical protein
MIAVPSGAPERLAACILAIRLPHFRKPGHVHC